jgi:hypothetical protein
LNEKEYNFIDPTHFKDIHFYDIHDRIVLIGFEGMKEAVIMVWGGRV